MDLPNLFSSNSEKDSQLTTIFIHLTDIKLQSFLLDISNEGVKILDKSTVSNYEGVDNCLVRVDESLQQLGKESEKVSTVIFGLNHDWVKSGEVIEEKKPLLKKLTDDLSLKPMGFIVISEAVVQQKISGNSMFSGIISIFTEKNLTLSLVSQGKVKSIESVGRSSDGKGDFLEGLARFSAKSLKDGYYLPTKIILASLDLDEAELKKHQQLIYDSDWSTQTQFLQPPAVSVVPQKEYEEMITKEAAKAIALQKGMTQAAMAVIAIKDTEIDSSTNLNSEELGFSEILPGTRDKLEDELDDKLEDEPDDKLEDKQDLDEGDVLDLDMNSEIDEKDADFDEKLNNKLPTSFGVPISSKSFDKELDMSEDGNLKLPDFEDDSELAVDFSGKSSGDRVDDEGSETKHIFGDKKSLDGKKIKKHYKNYKLYSLVGFFLGFIAFLVIAFFGIGNMASAEVVIGLETKPVSKDLEIVLDTSIKETDTDNLVLAADKLSKSKESESMMQTTGIKIVGEKAKGKVIIYNNLVAAEKLLTKGTVLSTGEIKFELDDDVTVPAASSPKAGELVPGKLEATVTALAIGAEGNIVEDTELTVLPFDKSSYYASAFDENFAGGASREVKVVSEADRLELLKDLRKELTEKINKEFQDESGNGIYIFPSKNIVSEVANFNFEVGNEAEELSLILNIEIEAISYTAEDLKPLASKVLASEIPENYILFDGDPQILSAPTESDLDSLDIEKPVTLSVNISSFAIPILSEETIKNDILGKSIEDAKSILVSKEEIKSVEISITPSIVKSLVRKIPLKQEKIKVDFK